MRQNLVEIKPKENRNHSVVILSCLMVACTQAGITMYSASMPYLPKIFHASYTGIAYTVSAYLLGYALATFFFGGMSDQIGRKKCYIYATIIFSIASLMLAIIDSIYMFLALRFMQGIGGGGCAVISRTSVRDIYEGKKLARAMSYISISFIISLGIFQYIGGVFQEYGSYRFDFIFMAGLGAIALIYTIFVFSETYSPLDNKVSFSRLFQGYLDVFSNKSLVIFAFGGSLGYSILLVFNVLAVHYLTEYLQVKPSTIGVIGVCFSISYMVGSVIINYLVESYEIKTIIKISKCIFLVSGLLSILSLALKDVSLYMAVIPSLIGFFSQALLYPCVLSKALESNKNNFGVGGSLIGFIQQACGFIIILISSSLPLSYLASFEITIFIIGVSVFILLDERFLHRKN